MKRTMAGMALALFAGAALAEGFSFSKEEAKRDAEDQAVRAQRDREFNDLMASPCIKTLKGKKTAVIVAEEHSDGGFIADYKNFGPLFTSLNRELSTVGLRTFTPEQIRAQIKAEEIRALMNNDPDAQISAASRLGASFILRGLIRSRSVPNPAAPGVNNLTVTVTMTLVRSNGKVIGSVTETSESFAGSDASGLAQSLVEEKAHATIAHLFAAYCGNN